MKKTMIVPAAFLCSLLWSFSCFALTPDQVIKLKKAGVSDKTIQMMIKQEEDTKDPTATMGIKEIKDNDGNTVVIYTNGRSQPSAADDEEAKKVDKAWDMLRNMTIKKQ